MKCRSCGSQEVKEFLSLGRTPLANSFLTKDDLMKKESYYPLALAFCGTCFLVQLTHVVDPLKLFSHYVYVSSTTKTFHYHFGEMAKKLIERFSLSADSVVVDIGSNDGLLLKFFKERGVEVIGVEPASNLAQIANDQGIETINAFFDNGVADTILTQKGKVDVITANNVFAHIANIHDVTENVKRVLKEEGVFVIEFQYFFDTIQDMTFDNVYHEHLYYYTLMSITHFFQSHGMVVFDVEHVDTHGGSLRVYVQKDSCKRPVAASVPKLLEEEEKKGVKDIALYQAFSSKVKSVKEGVVTCLNQLKEEGKLIVGYGAPAKSTTLLHYCGISNKEISYIVEDNPMKQGLYTPGTHITIFGPQQLVERKPDVILILAWNFAKEILEKHKNLHEKGVQFLIPLPQPRLL